jgi:hypothetical protein
MKAHDDASLGRYWTARAKRIKYELVVEAVTVHTMRAFGYTYLLGGYGILVFAALRTFR